MTILLQSVSKSKDRSKSSRRSSRHRLFKLFWSSDLVPSLCFSQLGKFPFGGGGGGVIIGPGWRHLAIIIICVLTDMGYNNTVIYPIGVHWRIYLWVNYASFCRLFL
jgi:hypothetical protein